MLVSYSYRKIGIINHCSPYGKLDSRVELGKKFRGGWQCLCCFAIIFAGLFFFLLLILLPQPDVKPREPDTRQAEADKAQDKSFAVPEVIIMKLNHPESELEIIVDFLFDLAVEFVEQNLSMQFIRVFDNEHRPRFVLFTRGVIIIQIR